MTTLSEWTQKAKNGDTEAFAKLYEMVYEDLYRTAYYSLRGNTHDASDAVSETVMDAFTYIHQLKRPEAFRKWIYEILLTKIKRKQREYYQKDAMERMGQIRTEETVDFSYASSELREALSRFSDTDRMILSMSVLGGYTGEEIGMSCGVAPGTVRSRLSRMKASLRMLLGE